MPSPGRKLAAPEDQAIKPNVVPKSPMAEAISPPGFAAAARADMPKETDARVVFMSNNMGAVSAANDIGVKFGSLSLGEDGADG